METSAYILAGGETVATRHDKLRNFYAMLEGDKCLSHIPFSVKSSPLPESRFPTPAMPFQGDHPTLFKIFILFILPFRATSAAYGSSQARGSDQSCSCPGLQHSYGNAGSELHLRPTPQLMATLDPRPTKRGQGLNLHPRGY